MCTIYRKREKICNKIGITHIREINVKKKIKKSNYHYALIYFRILISVGVAIL